MNSRKAQREFVVEAHPTRVTRLRSSERVSLLCCALCSLLAPVGPSHSLLSGVGLHAEYSLVPSHQFPLPSKGTVDKMCKLFRYPRQPTSQASRESCGTCRGTEAEIQKHEDKSRFFLHAFAENYPLGQARVFPVSMTRTSAPGNMVSLSMAGIGKSSITYDRPHPEMSNNTAKEKTDGTKTRGSQQFWMKGGKAEGQLPRDDEDTDSSNNRPESSLLSPSRSHFASLKEKHSPPLHAFQAGNNGVIEYSEGEQHNHDVDEKIILLDESSAVTPVANARLEHVPQRQRARQRKTGLLFTATPAGNTRAALRTFLFPKKNHHYKEESLNRNDTSGLPVEPLRISFAQLTDTEGHSLNRMPVLPRSRISDDRSPGRSVKTVLSLPLQSRDSTLENKESRFVDPRSQVSLLRKPGVHLGRFALGAQGTEKFTHAKMELPEVKGSIGNDTVASNKILEDSSDGAINSKTETTTAHIEMETQRSPLAGVSGSNIFSYVCCLLGGITTFGAVYVLVQLQEVTKELSGVKKALILTSEMPFVVV